MTDKREASRRRFVRTGIAGALSFGLAGCTQIAEEVRKQVGGSTDSGDGSGGGDGGSAAAIGYGETHEGSVDQSDGTAPQYGGVAEPVTFEGQSGDPVSVAMTSQAFDTYLVLQAPDGSVVAQNDDRSSDYNSRIRQTLSQSGTYTVWCTS